MHYLLNPLKLQFELSSMCNALCLGCVRTDWSSFNDKKETVADKQYISFETFKKILLAPEFNSVTELEFCGTVDDPLMHPEFLDFLDWASTVGNYNVSIHTNASLRNEDYWKKLAQILIKHRRHVVKFSIDGLEDTNHIYRQNTNWNKIIKNAQSFIAAGGYASWQFLIFPWNQHQLNAAKQLSSEMGFKEFMSRHDRSVATNLGLEKIQQIKIYSGRKIIEPVTIDRLNQSLSTYRNDSIDCFYKNTKMYFISYDSRLWPCCFVRNGFLNLAYSGILNSRLFDAYNDKNWNSIVDHSIEEILAHEFYQNDLVDSWTTAEHGTGKKHRIHRCTQVCSTKKLTELPIGNHKVQEL